MLKTKIPGVNTSQTLFGIEEWKDSFFAMISFEVNRSFLELTFSEQSTRVHELAEKFSFPIGLLDDTGPERLIEKAERYWK